MSDYAAAVTPETKILLKVHASNYKIIGFTASASLAELAALARQQDLIVMEDLGSGALIDLARYGLPPEPTVAGAIKQGADVVAFSGDKLLGGPQCGILVGRRDLVARMAAHPLFRALRADKMTLAALEATLHLYEDEDTLRETLPVLRMLAQTPDELLKRARRLRTGLAKLPGLHVTLADGFSYSGGGTLPEERLPTKQVRVRPLSDPASISPRACAVAVRPDWDAGRRCVRAGCADSARCGSRRGRAGISGSVFAWRVNSRLANALSAFADAEGHGVPCPYYVREGGQWDNQPWLQPPGENCRP